MKRNIQVMKSMPQVSDDEINQHMNFDELVSMHTSHKNQQFRRNLLFASLAATAVAVLIWWAVDTTGPATPVESSPAVVIADSMKVDETPPSPEISQEKKTAESTRSLVQEEESGRALRETPSKEPPDIYLEAEPINGYPDLYAYFDRELRYPSTAVKDSIEGTESVSFIINRHGKPEQITILHSLGDAFDQESIRLINHMPLWKAASMNGRYVQAKITIPLTFDIAKTNHP